MPYRGVFVIFVSLSLKPLAVLIDSLILIFYFPSRAPPIPEVAHTDASTESLVDVDSVHVNTVPADYPSQPVKTETQAERLEREAEDEERELEAEYDDAKRQAKREAKAKAHQAKVKAQEAKDKAQDKAQEVKDKTQNKAHEVKDKAQDKAHEVKDKAHEVKDKAQAEAREKADKASKAIKSTSKDIQRNSDNPVIVGNAVVVAVLSAALGFGAYRKYAAGELTWKVVGTWAGLAGLFATGDYYFSQ